MATDVHDRIPRFAVHRDAHRYPPSFSYKVREILHREMICRQAGAPDPRFRITQSKLGAYAFLDRLGEQHATVRAVVPLAKVTPRMLAGGAVIKPLKGKSAIGVAALRPDGDGWVDLIRDRRHTFASLIRWLTKQLDRLKTVDRWIVEELAYPPDGHPIPVVDDVKVYAFRGEVGLVLMRRGYQGKVRYRWFDADLAPADTGKYAKKVDPTLELPDNMPDVLDVAARVSRAVPFAFTRVDTMITDRGVLVGELNSNVGAYDGFNDEWDQRLGRLWERAEALMEGPRSRPVPGAVVDGGYPLRWWQRFVPAR